MTQLWIAPGNVAFIIVDVQNDFCPGGSLAVAGGDEIIQIINQMKLSFGTNILTRDAHPKGHSSFATTHGRDPFTQVWMKNGIIVGDVQEGQTDTDAPVAGAIKQTLWTDHCVPGTKGAEFHEDLFIQPNDLILPKGTNPKVDSYSGFFENDGQTKPTFDNGKTLDQVLNERGIDTVVLAGLAYDYCVGWHGLDAAASGFNVIVLKDATRSIVMPAEEAGGLNSEQAMTKELEQAGVLIIDSPQLKHVLGGPNGPTLVP